MRKREYRDYLNDIAESINDVASFVEGMDYDDFLHDRKTVNAVVSMGNRQALPPEIKEATRGAFQAGRAMILAGRGRRFKPWPEAEGRGVSA